MKYISKALMYEVVTCGNSYLMIYKMQKVWYYLNNC